ncbi:MAG: hypothetical protein ABR499_20015 [Gemmatimonadaceae bacterium]
MARLAASARPPVFLLLALIACNDGTSPPDADLPANVVITPGQVRLAAAGDTMRLRAALYDELGYLIPGVAVTWTAADPTVFTIDAGGLVTGLQPLSVGRAIASVGNRADTAYVVVANPDASPCLGYSPPVTLAVGQSINVSRTDAACIASAGSGDEYIIVPWQGSMFGTSTVVLEVTGSGLATVGSSQSLAPPSNSRSMAREGSALGALARPRRSTEFERTLRETGRREVMPLARRAREALRADSASASRTSLIPAYLGVGDLVELNTGLSACVSPTMRTGRVTAVTSRAIVVHDTTNPAGGFTDADYQRFAVTFDTLITAVADAAFAAPTDIDFNGKVVIFFTRAVNELTPPGANEYVAGFFHPRDVLPQWVYGSPYCPASNEREMFYMLVPDPNGVVNNNARSVGFVDTLTLGVLAHEHQHLVNFSRRVYVNNAFVDEELWLNEGLSHIAEELVFYRAATAAPRQNIGGERFGAQPFDGLFTQYMAPNFDRLHSYLLNTHSYSPYTPGDDLATRGAVWAFLRYAADRRASSDGDVWMRLVNSTMSGFDNLGRVFGPSVLQMIHDWNLSVYTDDNVPGIDATQAQPSWNFRTAYPALPKSPRPYPLVDAVRTLSNDVSQTLSLRSGGGAFYRFAVNPGGQAAVRVTSGGLVPPPVVQATIVRTQ